MPTKKISQIIRMSIFIIFCSIRIIVMLVFDKRVDTNILVGISFIFMTLFWIFSIFKNKQQRLSTFIFTQLIGVMIFLPILSILFKYYFKIIIIKIGFL